MPAPRVRRLLVGLVTSVVPAALVAGGLSQALLSAPTFTASYAARGTARDPGTGACVDAALRADVTGTSSTARHRLFGWHDAAVSGPAVAVGVTDCATGAPYAGLDTLRVDQVWAEQGCSLAAEQGDSFAASAEETDDQDADDAEGWQRTDGDARCAEPAAQGTVTGDGPALGQTQPDLVLHFAGHTWSRDLCWTPVVRVWLTTRAGATTVVPVALSAACVSAT
jgi:hypothetical protein